MGISLLKSYLSAMGSGKQIGKTGGRFVSWSQSSVRPR